MNADLKLRLAYLEHATNKEKRFIEYCIKHISKVMKSPYPIDVFMCAIDPPQYPDDDTGFVEFDGYDFTIKLDRRMPIGMILDYLIHEMAHVGTWFVNEPEDHGPMFGVEYARLYRYYLRLYDIFWSENR